MKIFNNICFIFAAGVAFGLCLSKLTSQQSGQCGQLLSITPEMDNEVVSRQVKSTNTTTRSDVQISNELIINNAHVVVEIGLHKTVMGSKGSNHHVIGVEASLRSICKHLINKNNPRVHIVNAAMFDRDGVAVFHEMDGWMACFEQKKE